MHDFTTLEAFPFKTVLNLKPLVEFWTKRALMGEMPIFSNHLLARLEAAPELSQPIYDRSVLDRHHDLLMFLASAVIPPAGCETDLTAMISPFEFTEVFATKAFRDAMPLDRIDKMVSVNAPGNSMVLGKTLNACLLILKKFYGVDIKVDKPILFTTKDRETGLDKVYKVEMDKQFLEVVCNTTPKPIDKHVIKFLTEKFYDIDLWLQYIRPEDFEFHGFLVMRLVDVTEGEMLSSMKYDLLRKDAVSKPESFAQIQQKLRAIFGIADLRLGLAYMDPNNQLILNSGLNDSWKSLVQDVDQCNCDFTGSSYERSWTEQRYVTIENLNEYPYKTNAEKTLLQGGIQNLLLAPLVEDGETIGMLELATPTPGQLNSISVNKVENVLPMFTVAVKRVKDEMETEVRAIIQEECTAIHPTVQWRFFEAGVNVMNKRRLNEDAAFEEIVFKDVYPLFGMVDIRNSSVERSLSIQKDLQQNLRMAKELLIRINEQKRLPLVDEIIFKVDKHMARIMHGLASGDENNVLEFLKGEINPALKHFEQDKEINGWIKRYYSKLDPASGVVYKRRKAFEESLAAINVAVGDILDTAEETAQSMFPHYFEKYKTDGVEFTLYMGSSLVKNKTFDPFYLRNFRLWQLLTMCDIEQKMRALKPTLPDPLDVTQLILVHDNTLSLRFRADEKQFDVDGAYDIRYEIVKKRIDKAFVKNTGERLTQPGKIAIVYNQPKVEEEYRQYFKYLEAKNLIEGAVEELELEELPGASGLRALRIQVKKSEVKISGHNNLLRDIEQAVEA